MSSLRLSPHPLLKHKLTSLRDQATPSAAFRTLLREISGLLLYEATADLRLKPITVTTPMQATTGFALADTIALIPILRAGLGLLDGMLDLLPDARVGHIGLFRDEHTLQPVHYYAKLPPQIEQAQVFVLDPMLATGGSAIAAIDHLKQAGVTAIRLICVLAAPEGVERLTTAHPEVPIYAAALDERLNDIGYILPGLGDAGDRVFNTCGQP